MKQDTTVEYHLDMVHQQVSMDMDVILSAMTIGSGMMLTLALLVIDDMYY
jgi:hypothetical protein